VHKNTLNQVCLLFLVVYYAFIKQKTASYH